MATLRADIRAMRKTLSEAKDTRSVVYVFMHTDADGKLRDEHGRTEEELLAMYPESRYQLSFFRWAEHHEEVQPPTRADQR